MSGFFETEPPKLIRGLMPLPPDVEGSAVFKKSGTYRIRLERWTVGHKSEPAVLFVGMNPSKAGATHNDASAAKMWRFTRRWEFHRMMIGNTFGLISTDPKGLIYAKDPIGPDNDVAIMAMAKSASMVIMCFGTPKDKRLRERGETVTAMLRKEGIVLRVLSLSVRGRPSHPLYLPETLMPTLWNP